MPESPNRDVTIETRLADIRQTIDSGLVSEETVLSHIDTVEALLLEEHRQKIGQVKDLRIAATRNNIRSVLKWSDQSLDTAA